MTDLLPAAFSTSKRYLRVSSRIEKGLALFDALPEIRIANCGRYDQVHRAAEEYFQRFFESEESIRVIASRKGLELYQKIQIAMLRIEAAVQRRAEYLKAPDVKLPAKLKHLGSSGLSDRFHR